MREHIQYVEKEGARKRSSVTVLCRAEVCSADVLEHPGHIRPLLRALLEVLGVVPGLAGRHAGRIRAGILPRVPPVIRGIVEHEGLVIVPAPATRMY